MPQLNADFLSIEEREKREWRGTEVVVTGSTRNRLVPLKTGHVGSNPTLSARKFRKLNLTACYSERLLYINIGNEVMAGSRKVLFQAATNKLQTHLDGTQAS